MSVVVVGYIIPKPLAFLISSRNPRLSPLAVRYIRLLSSLKASMQATCNLQFPRNPMFFLAKAETLGSFRGSFSLYQPFRNLRSLCDEAETLARFSTPETSALSSPY